MDVEMVTFVFDTGTQVKLGRSKFEGYLTVNEPVEFDKYIHI
jgi:hypothetical protein